MKSLRARVLLLVVGFGLIMAALFAIIMHASVRQYYADWMYAKNAAFAQRVVEAHPDLWHDYAADPGGFGATLRQYTLYSPHTGLYLLDLDGRVLATAGERQPFWPNYRVDLAPITETMAADPALPILADDPDDQDRQSLVAARQVMHDGQPRGWLYVVARQTDIDTAMPALLKSYAIRAAATAGLMTVAIGVLLTIAMISLLTRPLTALTRATEQIRNAGFSGELRADLFPDADRDDEIGRLSRTFREAFDRLRLETERVRTVDAHRREMVASVSHDLRTPLTRIRLSAEFLDDAELRDGIVRDIEDMDAIIDQFISFIRDGRDEPVLPADLNALVRETAQAYDPARVKLDLGDIAQVPFRRLAIKRLLDNLLTNAFRYAPEGDVDVRTRPIRGAVILSISDRGPGVPEAQMAELLQPFMRGDKARTTKGSGLGLAIVQRIANMHGGRLELRNRDGGGLTVRVFLPTSERSTRFS